MNLEDKIAIYEVIAQYSYTYDGKNVDGFAELFTEDAGWEARRQRNAVPYIHHKSQKTIRDWVTERLQGRPATTFSRHFQTGTLFEELTLNTAPSDLPVQLPQKFALLVNLKTAKQLGIMIPPTVLYQATEVIR